MDGKLAEFKQVDSASLGKIKERIIECEEQRAKIAIIRLMKINIKDTLKEAKKITDLQSIKEIYLISGNNIAIIKK